MRLPEYFKEVVSLKPEQEKEFASYIDCKEYSKGEFLFKQGEVCRKIFFVEKGLARGFYYSESGKEITAWFVIENSYVTSLDSFIPGNESKLSCDLLEDSVVFSISYNALEELLNKNHEFAKFAFKTLYEITRHVINFYSGLKFQSAKEKYNSLVKNQPSIFQRIPLVYIASFIGITPETLSRIRAEK